MCERIVIHRVFVCLAGANSFASKITRTTTAAALTERIYLVNDESGSNNFAVVVPFCLIYCVHDRLFQTEKKSEENKRRIHPFDGLRIQCNLHAMSQIKRLFKFRIFIM